jgi:OmpA-OmpF porin, OOP family
MTRLLSLLAILLLTLAVAETAEAQNPLDRARRAAERGAQRAIEREAERRADRAVTGAIECVAGDRSCAERAQVEGRDVTYVDEAGNPVSAEQAAGTQAAGTAQGQAPAAGATPGQGVWANYDFVPGDRVLFLEDYTNDRVGNFPQRLTFFGGNIEIVEWEGGRALRINSKGGFDIALSETLPERFTLEFDAYLSEFVNDFLVYPVREDGEPAGPQHIQVDPYGGTGIVSFHNRGTISAVESDRVNLEHRMTPVRVMADGSYLKVYLGERRVANVPNADLGRTRVLRFDMNDVRSQPIYLGPIRIAASDRSLYDALIADGRFATQGILFATGSATIQPESTPTLKDIARALQQNGDLRLRIEGHTDSVGSPDANLRLSEQRAQAVVDYLVQREGIGVARLVAAGLGQTQSAADNATPEGRQTNRRVELVVL